MKSWEPLLDGILLALSLTQSVTATEIIELEMEIER
jgi:hypothetical protein